MSEAGSAPALKNFRFPLDQLAGDGPHYRWVSERMELMIFRWQGEYRVFSSICPHMGAQLGLDTRQQALVCPWHGLACDLATKETNHHRYRKLKEFSARVEGTELVIVLGEL